jgi:hypothetical protein
MILLTMRLTTVAAISYAHSICWMIALIVELVSSQIIQFPVADLKPYDNVVPTTFGRLPAAAQD